MARPRKPTSLLTASGAFEHDPARGRAREHEPIPTGPIGEPPASFTDLQRDAWHELLLIVPPGVLTNADRVLVEMYCGLVARQRGQLNSMGMPEPLKAAESRLLLDLLGRMGLTPADRSRIVAPTPEAEHAKDTFSRLAAEGRGKPQ